MNPSRLLIVCNSLAYFLNHRKAPAELARAEGFAVHIAASADADPEVLSRLGLAFHPIVIARHPLAPFFRPQRGPCPAPPGPHAQTQRGSRHHP